MEDGIALAGVLGVTVTKDTSSAAYTADKSYNEILSAYNKGLQCICSLYGGHCVLNKDDEYPEIYGYVLQIETVHPSGSNVLRSYYVEFTSEGVTVDVQDYTLTPAT